MVFRFTQMMNFGKFLDGHPRIKGFIKKWNKIDWAMVEATATVFILVFAIVTVYYAIDANNKADSLTLQLLQIQNTTSNFQPRILPYSLLATFDDISYSPNSPTNASIIYARGSLNMSFIIFTPHGLIMNFSYPVPFNFTTTSPVGTNDLSTPDPARLNETTLFFNPTGDLYGRIASYPEAYVQPELSQVNFTVPLAVSFFPNPLWSTMSPNSGTELRLGKIGVNLSVYDVQTEQYLPAMFFSFSLASWMYIA